MNATPAPVSVPELPERDADASLPPAPHLRLRRDWADLLVGAVILGLAAWFFTTARGLDDYSGEGIGAADFPEGIAALLAVGVAVICIGAVRRLATGDGRKVIAIRRYGHVAVGMVLLVAFPALMTSLGYYIAMAVWLAAFLVLCDVRRPIPLIAYVAGFLLFTKVVFEMLLGTPLP